jgi:hypothetical protein
MSNSISIVLINTIRFYLEKLRTISNSLNALNNPMKEYHTMPNGEGVAVDVSMSVVEGVDVGLSFLCSYSHPYTLKTSQTNQWPNWLLAQTLVCQIVSEMSFLSAAL